MPGVEGPQRSIAEVAAAEVVERRVAAGHPASGQTEGRAVPVEVHPDDDSVLVLIVGKDVAHAGRIGVRGVRERNHRAVGLQLPERRCRDPGVEGIDAEDTRLCSDVRLQRGRLDVHVRERDQDVMVDAAWWWWRRSVAAVVGGGGGGRWRWWSARVR